MTDPNAPCPAGKIRYSAAADAEQSLRRARQARRAGQVGNGDVETSCGLCAGWHVTSDRHRAPGGRGRRRGSRSRQPGRRG